MTEVKQKMHLTKERRSMLDGHYGEAIAYSIEGAGGNGSCLGAKRMVPVTRTHVALSSQDADCWFVEKIVNMSEKSGSLSPTVNPSVNLKYLDHIWLRFLRRARI